MFKKLRNRFLLIHMGVVSLLIGLFFGSVLLLSYNVLEQSSNDRVDMLWRSQMVSQSVAIISTQIPDALLAVTPPENSGNMAFFTKPSAAGRTGLLMRATPCIYVTTDDQQTIQTIESAYDMDDAFYTRITKAAFAGREAVGKVRVDNFTLKYKREENTLLFVDVTAEAGFFTGMARSLLLIALPLLGMIFLLSLFFANRSIKPIEVSYNRQKEFIADASHELKTPLAAISTNLEVLGGSAGPDEQKWLGYIQSEVGRMSGLTNSLLYLAKMDYGAAQPLTLPVDISRVLADVWLPLEAAIFEKGVKTNIDAAPDVYVPGDEEQLRKLIGILTDNAIKYALKEITVSLIKNQNQAVLIIANDGPGIPPEHLARIWERFYRCDPSRQYDGGFGLGLPMAKAITERHKGRITCESVPGESTIFTVRLPV